MRSSRRIASRLSWKSEAGAHRHVEELTAARVSQIIRLVSPAALPLTMTLGRADGVSFGDFAQADGNARDGPRVVDQHGLAHGDSEFIRRVLNGGAAGLGRRVVGLV